MSRSIPCKNCCYCKTGENQYCINPTIVKLPYVITCGVCCYCKTGEVQHCESYILITK